MRLPIVERFGRPAAISCIACLLSISAFARLASAGGANGFVIPEWLYETFGGTNMAKDMKPWGPDSAATVAPPAITIDDGPPAAPEHSIAGDLTDVYLDCGSSTREVRCSVEAPSTAASSGAQRVGVHYQLGGDWNPRSWLTYRFTLKGAPYGGDGSKPITISIPVTQNATGAYTVTELNHSSFTVTLPSGASGNPAALPQAVLDNLFASSLPRNSASANVSPNRFKPMSRWGFAASGFGGAALINNSSDKAHALPLIGGDFGFDYRVKGGFSLEPFAGVRWAKSMRIQEFGSEGTAGATFAKVSAGSTEVPFGLRIWSPEFAHFRFGVEASALPSFTHLGINEGACSGSTCTSSTTNFDRTLWGYNYGFRLSYPICPPMSSNLRAFIGYDRTGALKFTSGSIEADFQSDEFDGGIEYDW